MTTQPLDPRQRNWEKATLYAGHVLPLASRCTVRLSRKRVKHERLTTESFGTGVLAMIGRRPYLLTAAHVADDIKRCTDYLKIGNIELRHADLTTGLGDYITNRPPGERPEEDPYDASAVEIRDTLASMLDDSFLDESWFEEHDPGSVGNQYVIAGYQAGSRPSKPPKPMATSLYRLERGQPPDYQPGHEALFNYWRKFTRDSSFNRNIAVHPKGMSGGGVWRSYSAEVPESEWSPDLTRLVAILHYYNSDLNICRATKIGKFKEMIAEARI